jgi:hypothetical protein
MPSVKQFAGYLVAGAVVSGFFVHPAQAQTQDKAGFSMGRLATIPLQTRADGAPSFAFQQTGALTTQLKAYLDGFLFCANTANDTALYANLKLIPAYENHDFQPAHPWAFPDVVDAATFSYTDGQLAIPENVFGPTLTCRATGISGQISSATSEGIFDNAFESSTVTNFGHIVNWKAPNGFDWSAPDWSQVPTDACTSTVTQPAEVVEDTVCLAATGVRVDGSGNPVRSGSMWTATDGVTFTYLFRVDARLGPQAPDKQTVFQLPQVVDGTTAPDRAVFALRDAYENGENTNIGYLGKSGQYCFLTELPAVLNSSVCANAPSVHPLTDGVLKESFTLAPPPIGPGVNQAFYVVVTRTVKGAHSDSLHTPVVGAAVLLEPAVADEGGDKFVGDDIVFGFMPSSAGFPWIVR